MRAIDHPHAKRTSKSEREKGARRPKKGRSGEVLKKGLDERTGSSRRDDEAPPCRQGMGGWEESGYPQASRSGGRAGATERWARRRTTSHTSARAFGTRGKPHRETVHKFSTCPCRLLEASGSESGKASGLPEDQSRETIEAPRTPGFSARVESRFQRHGARRPKPSGKSLGTEGDFPFMFGESKHTSCRANDRGETHPHVGGRPTPRSRCALRRSLATTKMELAPVLPGRPRPFEKNV